MPVLNDCSTPTDSGLTASSLFLAVLNKWRICPGWEAIAQSSSQKASSKCLLPSPKPVCLMTSGPCLVLAGCQVVTPDPAQPERFIEIPVRSVVRLTPERRQRPLASVLQKGAQRMREAGAARGQKCPSRTCGVVRGQKSLPGAGSRRCRHLRERYISPPRYLPLTPHHPAEALLAGSGRAPTVFADMGGAVHSAPLPAGRRCGTLPRAGGMAWRLLSLLLVSVCPSG